MTPTGSVTIRRSSSTTAVDVSCGWITLRGSLLDVAVTAREPVPARMISEGTALAERSVPTRLAWQANRLDPHQAGLHALVRAGVRACDHAEG